MGLGVFRGESLLLGFFYPPEFLAGALRAFFGNLLYAPVRSFGMAAGAKLLLFIFSDHCLTPLRDIFLVQGYGLHRANKLARCAMQVIIPD